MPVKGRNESIDPAAGSTRRLAVYSSIRPTNDNFDRALERNVPSALRSFCRNHLLPIITTPFTARTSPVSLRPIINDRRAGIDAELVDDLDDGDTGLPPRDVDVGPESRDSAPLANGSGNNKERTRPVVKGNLQNFIDFEFKRLTGTLGVHYGKHARLRCESMR